jgi:hypothetical protein
MRAEYYSDLKGSNILLQKFAPFVFLEAQRQGKF